MEGNGNGVDSQSESPATINTKRLKGNGGSISTFDGEAPPAELHLPPARIGETDSSGEQLGGVLALRADSEPEKETLAACESLDPIKLTVHIIFERALKVFPPFSTEVAKSGVATIANKCNSGLLARAREALKEYIQRASAEAKMWQPPSRAALEKMLAWLVVDMLGGMLVDAAVAEKIGKRLLKRLDAFDAEVVKVDARCKASIKLATSGKHLSSAESMVATAPAKIKKEQDLKVERDKPYTNFVEAFPPAPAPSESALVALPEKQPMPPAPAGCMGCRVQKALMAELREENAILRGKLLDFGMLPTRVLARHRCE